MTALTLDRERHRLQGLALLPDVDRLLAIAGANGEALATDEAAVWKRVLDYRVAQWLQPARILETHPGRGISTYLFHRAASEARICACTDWRAFKAAGEVFDLIDVDPWGQPWDALERVLPWLAVGGVLMVSNGEALAVWRNLRRQQRYPTRYYGKRLPFWVIREYIPRLERTTGLPCRYFYAFPTTVRAVLSRRAMPASLWEGCPQWMWWLARYAPERGCPAQLELVLGGHGGETTHA